ncbi:MAG: hypothetical protein QOE70_2433 [Chthoniobacter sp.]|nr:hypothetical protein [Chthoniobacter sp.]
MLHFVLALLATSLVLIQAFIGGNRLVYAIPCYLLLALAALGALGIRKRRLRVQPAFGCLLSALALGIYLALRSQFSPVEYLARPHFFLILAALIVYLLCGIELSGTRQRLVLIWVLSLFGLAQVALAVVQFRDVPNFMALPWVFRPDWGFRASGFYISPNQLAGLLGMLAMPMLSICCWSRGETSTRAFAFYGFIACLTGLAITGSRGGYLSTGVGLFVFAGLSLLLAWRFNRPHFLLLSVATALILTALVTATLFFIVKSEVYEKRLSHVREGRGQPAELWRAGIKQFRLAPAFGTGSGTYLYYGRQFRNPAVQSDPQHAHNEYLELLAEYGWVGGGLLAVFLGSHFIWAAVGLRRVLDLKMKPSAWTASNELALLLGAISALAVILVHCITDFSLHLPANALFVAFLFAILANPTVESLQRFELRSNSRAWLRFVAPALGALLLFTAGPRLSGEIFAERARIALRDLRYPEAAALAQRGLEREQKNPDLFYYLGEAHHHLALKTSHPKEAAELLRQAASTFADGLKVFPQDERLLLKMGRTCDQLGQFAEAETCFRRALELDPNSGTVHAYYGLHWHLQRQFGKARPLYERARQLGETQISSAGLRDLERDQAAARSHNPFTELLPEEPPKE